MPVDVDKTSAHLQCPPLVECRCYSSCSSWRQRRRRYYTSRFEQYQCKTCGFLGFLGQASAVSRVFRWRLWWLTADFFLRSTETAETAVKLVLFPPWAQQSEALRTCSFSIFACYFFFFWTIRINLIFPHFFLYSPCCSNGLSAAGFASDLTDCCRYDKKP